MRQLPLGVQLGVSLRFETYTAGRNGEAVEALKRLAEGVSRVPVWIYGATGSGKSHLLQAACAQAGVAGKASAYLPLAVVRGDGPAILDGFERLDLVALDDMDAIAGDDAWEYGLFKFFNGLAEHGGRLASRPCERRRRREFGCLTLPPASPLRRCIAWSLSRTRCRRRHSRPGRASWPRARPRRHSATRRGARRGISRRCAECSTRSTPNRWRAQRRLTVPFVRDWLARSHQRGHSHCNQLRGAERSAARIAAEGEERKGERPQRPELSRCGICAPTSVSASTSSSRSAPSCGAHRSRPCAGDSGERQQEQRLHRGR